MDPKVYYGTMGRDGQEGGQSMYPRHYRTRGHPEVLEDILRQSWTTMVKGARHKQKSRGDSESPWNIPRQNAMGVENASGP